LKEKEKAEEVKTVELQLDELLLQQLEQLTTAEHCIVVYNSVL